MHTFAGEDVDRRARGAAEAVRAPPHAVQPGPLWGTIDMDFMNLNQAAHGDRESGSSAAACASTAKASS
jgi:hypothetical protein